MTVSAQKNAEEFYTRLESPSARLLPNGKKYISKRRIHVKFHTHVACMLTNTPTRPILRQIHAERRHRRNPS